MDTDALQRLDAFLSDPKVPQEDKARAVAMARVQEGTPASRSGSYLTNKASQFVGALQGVQKDVTNLVTGEPYGTGFPGQRGALDTIGDVATTAAPIVAPGLTAAGLAAGTLARGGGLDEPTADLINAGTQLGIGGAQAVTGAARSVAEAPARLKAAAQAKYAQAAAGARGTITAADPFVQSLSDALESNLTHPAERAMATPLLAKVTAPGSPGLDYADLDNALAGLRRVRGPSYVRGLIDDAAQSLVQGPAAEARTAGKAAWASLRSKPFRVGALVPGMTGASLAARDLSEGRYKRAALTLGGTALATAGLRGLTGRGILAAVQGAAGPLAQTAVAVGGGQIPGLATAPDQGYTPKPSLPPGASPAPTTTAARGQPPLAALPGPYGREIAAVSSLVGVPAPLLHSVMQQESEGNPNAVSHPAPDQAQTPAHGLMQITPGTFATVAPQASKLLGRTADINNPFDNILASGLLWRKYLDRTNGDTKLAEKMYFGGENPRAWGPRTQQYAEDVTRRFLAEPQGVPGTPTAARSNWRQNLDQRVRAGYITQAQADAEAGG